MEYDIIVESHLKQKFRIKADSLDEATLKAIDDFVEYELTAEGVDNRELIAYEEMKKDVIDTSTSDSHQYIKNCHISVDVHQPNI